MVKDVSLKKRLRESVLNFAVTCMGLTPDLSIPPEETDWDYDGNVGVTFKYFIETILTTAGAV
jgi:hypothetical protein